MVKVQIDIPTPSSELTDQLARQGVLSDAVELREGLRLESRLEWPEDELEEIAGNAGFAVDGALPSPSVIHIVVTIATGITASVAADELERLIHGPKVMETETVIVEQQQVSLGALNETLKRTVISKREER